MLSQPYYGFFKLSLRLGTATPSQTHPLSPFLSSSSSFSGIFLSRKFSLQQRTNALSLRLWLQATAILEKMDKKLRPPVGGGAPPQPLKKIKDGKLVARVSLCAINASFRGELGITISFIQSQTNRWKITDSPNPQRKKKNRKKDTKIARHLRATQLNP